MWLLNSIRQVYECPNQIVPRLLAKHAEGTTGLELLNRFIVLHHAVTSTGQNVRRNDRIFLPLSEELYESMFKWGKVGIEGRVDINLPHVKFPSLTYGEAREFEDFFHDENHTWQELLDHYNSHIEKNRFTPREA
jgi:hypothetical protein